MKRGALVLLAFIVAAGVTIDWVVRARRGTAWRALHAPTAPDARSGGLQSLLRARMGAVRLALSEPESAEVLAEVAYLNAFMAHHYGLDTARAASETLQRLDRSPATGAAAAGAAAARALLALGRGDRATAEALAEAGAASDRQDIRPLLVRSRVRALAGDLVGAIHIAEAASLKVPGAGAPLVEWAEARLDAGQPEPALEALRRVLKRTPDHARARLLLAEAGQGTARGGAGEAAGAAALAAACQRDGAVSPVVATACHTLAATRARLAGDAAGAIQKAQAAAAAGSGEPRTLARSALVLAQLGEVDLAVRLSDRAAAVASVRMPLLAWARLAIALGRGQTPPRPPPLPAAHPETRLLAARAAFASAGGRALRRALASIGPQALGADPDLRALATLTGAVGRTGHREAPEPNGQRDRRRDQLAPSAAYAAGLRAQLAGDLPAAADLLGRALWGHGDACRAAGEYLVVMRLLRRPTGTELDRLRAADQGCINLVLPPPRQDARANVPARLKQRRSR